MILTITLTYCSYHIQQVRDFFRWFMETEQFELQGETFVELHLQRQQHKVMISDFGRLKHIYNNGKVRYTLGTMDRGYYKLCCGGNKYYKVHILVFETFYRKLLPNEVVHHLSEVKTQNQKTNLVAWDLKRHTTYHSSHRTEAVKNKVSATLKGRPRSEEIKRKISAGKKGKPFSEEHKLHLRKPKRR